jgi:hypothetical protein
MIWGREKQIFSQMSQASAQFMQEWRPEKNSLGDDIPAQDLSPGGERTEELYILAGGVDSRNTRREQNWSERTQAKKNDKAWVHSAETDRPLWRKDRIRQHKGKNATGEKPDKSHEPLTTTVRQIKKNWTESRCAHLPTRDAPAHEADRDQEI